MKFELPLLPYAISGLEPYISQKTLEYHYGKHHQTYITILNNLISETKFENANLETIIKESDGPIFNNAAQVWNHNMYFKSFNKNGKRIPEGPLFDAIVRNFGTFAGFQEAFTTASLSMFGAGWIWLSKNKNGQLEISQESNAGNTMSKGLQPILNIDIWEHAYYLDYKNRRQEYLDAYWKILDWEVIEKRF